MKKINKLIIIFLIIIWNYFLRVFLFTNDKSKKKKYLLNK